MPWIMIVNGEVGECQMCHRQDYLKDGTCWQCAMRAIAPEEGIARLKAAIEAQNFSLTPVNSRVQ